MSKVKEKLKNDSLMPLRHTAEHILQSAMETLYPEIKKAMGPAIEDGFYYDFDLSKSITPEDFPKIEDAMKKIIKANLPMTRKVLSEEDAKSLFKGNEYKQELIAEIIKAGGEISVYFMGGEDDKYYDFDLCSGPHVKSTSEVKAFKLLNVAGAYWRGSEKNKMLQRIYGTAFDTKEKLKKHLEMLEEAQRRDHRKLGKDLDLFTFAEDVGPGLPLWLPNGMIIREELEKWGKETEEKWGYKRVASPFLSKRKLFEISSHIPYFEDEMYKAAVPDEEDEYFLKPMNCPFHHMIYKSKIRSYKELPLKLAEYGTVARYENRGALNGILRPRVFTQNDAHIYCTEEQTVDVFVEILQMHQYYYEKLGLKDYYIVLALRDPEKKNKYHGNDKMWEKSKKYSVEAMDKAGIEYVIKNEGAAHYGPKMDFTIKSAIGTEYGVSTNQIDFYMPERFGLTYIDSDGKEKPVVVQHRAPLGSHERFVGVLTEHFAGAFPVWLSPTQAIIIPIGDNHVEYAGKVADSLKEKGLRVQVDSSNDTMQAKIRNAQLLKVPYMLIIGDKEVKNSTVSVRLRTEESKGAIITDEFADRISKLYLTKSLELW